MLKGADRVRDFALGALTLAVLAVRVLIPTLHLYSLMFLSP